MATREKIFEVSFITDCDSGIYQIGEIDSIISDNVKDYVLRFGDFGYQEMIELASVIIHTARTQKIESHKSETAAQIYET